MSLGTRRITLGNGVKELTDQKLIGKLMSTTGSYLKHESTVDSILNRKQNATYLDNVDAALGDPYVYITYSDAGGNPITTPYFNKEIGQDVVPDDQGRVRALNGAYVEKIKKHEEDLRRQAHELYNKCIVSDTMAKLALDLTPAEYDATLGPTNAAPRLAPGMSAEMAKLDARISHIESLPEGSAAQTQAASKLFFVCKHRLDFFRVLPTHRSDAAAKDLAVIESVKP